MIWTPASSQHGVIARWQLLDVGASRSWIEHRIAKRRLHPIHRGVFAVGRPQLTRDGRFMTATLACGREAWLSHGSAATLWKLRFGPPEPIHVSVPAAVVRRPAGIEVHRSRTLEGDVTAERGIHVTTPARTLIDLATVLGPDQLEAAVNEADARNLIDPETLRRDLERRRGQPGVPALRALLDRHTYRLNESELERRFFESSSEPAYPSQTRSWRPPVAPTSSGTT